MAFPPPRDPSVGCLPHPVLLVDPLPELWSPVCWMSALVAHSTASVDGPNRMLSPPSHQEPPSYGHCQVPAGASLLRPHARLLPESPLSHLLCLPALLTSRSPSTRPPELSRLCYSPSQKSLRPPIARFSRTGQPGVCEALPVEAGLPVQPGPNSRQFSLSIPLHLRGRELLAALCPLLG